MDVLEALSTSKWQKKSFGGRSATKVRMDVLPVYSELARRIQVSNRSSVYSAPAGLSVDPAGLSALRAEGRLAAAFLLLAGLVVVVVGGNQGDRP